MTQLRLKLLGGFEARNGDGQVLAFPRKRAEVLLAYLALHPRQAHYRDKLAALLWADADREHARHNLRQVLVSLRQCLSTAGPSLLVEDGETVAMDPDGFHVDVLAFESLVAKGTPAALTQAAELYRGDLLASVAPGEDAADSWLLARREHVREQAMQALSQLLEHQFSQGQDAVAIATAARLLTMDRTRETVHRSLMRIYARQGRRGAARRQYQACLAALEQELGEPPEAETRALYRELLNTKQTDTLNSVFARADAALPRVSGMPLSGRGGELKLLRALCNEITHGHGASVVILGDGGIGKSRLIEALVAEAESVGALVLIGRAWEAERNLPFGPWVHAFRAAGVMPDLAASLGASSRHELARLFPDVGAAPSTVPAEDHLGIFNAMGEALRRLSTRGPLVVVIEDLHWADEMTLRLLAYMARAAAEWPVLLAATARPDEVRGVPLVERMLAEISRQPRARQIALAAISRAETLAIVGSLMQVGAGTRATRSLGARAWRNSKGNPFLAIETVRASRDAEPGGDGRTSGHVVSGRLDRVTGVAAQLVAVAAVVGREFDLELLARASGLTPAEAADGLAELVERRLLHAVGEHLDFSHDHIRAAAYSRLTTLHRKMLHGAVARALEDLNGENLSLHYLALGRHCYQSERWDRAFHYLRAAGVGAAARSAHREAATSFEQALAAAVQLPQSPERVRAAIDVSFALRGSLTLLGDLKGTLDCLRAAEPQARVLGDPRVQAWVSIFTGNCLTVMGRHAQAIDVAEQVRAAAATGALGAIEDYWTTNVLGTSRFFLGDFRQAQALLRPAAAAAEAADEAGYRKLGVIGHPAVVSHGFLAQSLAESGDFDDALVHAANALALSERLESSWDTVRACFSAGAVHMRRGDFATGIRVLRHGVELARMRDLPMGTRVLTPLLAAGLAREGKSAEALSVLAPIAAAPLLPYCLNFVAEGFFLAGRSDEAAGVAARALARSTENNEQGVRAWALWLLGLTGVRASPRTDTSHFQQALELAQEHDMRPLAAHCHMAMGNFSTALGQYDAMGMSYWAKRARTAQVQNESTDAKVPRQ
jgi:DNA-binding SARP family transcriptional activator